MRAVIQRVLRSSVEVDGEKIELTPKEFGILRYLMEHQGWVVDRETLLKWLKNFYRRFFAQQFKRSCMPDGVKVGTISMSPRGDLRMPSDASPDLWMKELESL